MTPDAIIAALTAFSNFAAIVYLGKRALERIDKHSDALAPIAESMRTINKAMENINRSLTELYNSRNEHDRRLTAGEMARKINGCETPDEMRRKWGGS
jgi:hypothetical protein